MAEGGETHLPPSGPPPSQIQTAPNLVAFNPKAVTPSQPLYLQRNDLVGFSTLSNVTGFTIRINYRWLTPEGEIKEGELDLSPPVSLLQSSFSIFEGWLLSFHARITATMAPGGWVFIQAAVFREFNAVLGPNAHALLWEGYLSTNFGGGWPGPSAKQITDGAGVLRSITGSTPAAGAEINEVVPSLRRWNLLGLFATLVSSATVINRTPAFFFDDGANIFSGSEGIFTQPASTTSRYSFSTVVPSQAFISNFLPVGLLLPFPLKANFRIRSTTLNLQAGDQWTAPQYLVQEWGAWDN